MTSRVISFLIAATAAYFWWWIVVPQLGRLFGVREPLSFKLRRHRTVKLNTVQRVFLEGVLDFGMGILIFSFIGEHLKYRFGAFYWELPVAQDVWAQVLIPLVCGGLFGLMGGHGKGQDSTA